MGWLPAGFEEETAGLASSPTYRIFQSDDPSGPGTIFAAVHLAIHARHPEVPNAYLEFRWDRDNPAWSLEPMIRGFGSASSSDIQRIAYHGRSLFAIHRASRGRYPDEVEIVCRGFKCDLDHVIPDLRDRLWEDEGYRHDRPLRQRDLAKALSISEDTLAQRMKNCKISWRELRLRES